MELRGRGLLARALEWSSCLAVSFKCSWECSAGNWATAPRASHCPPRPYSTPLHLHLQRPNLRCPPFLRRVSLSFPRVDHWPCGLPTARHRWVHRSVALASLRLLSGAKYWRGKRNSARREVWKAPWGFPLPPPARSVEAPLPQFTSLLLPGRTEVTLKLIHPSSASFSWRSTGFAFFTGALDSSHQTLLP